MLSSVPKKTVRQTIGGESLTKFGNNERRIISGHLF